MSRYKKEWDEILTSNAHPQKSFAATLDEVRWLEQQTRGLHKDNYRLLAHILISTIRCLRRGEADEQIFIPVCAKFIHDYFSKARWEKLQNRGLIIATKQSFLSARSREFAIAYDKLDEFVELSAKLSVEGYGKAVKYNLMTGKKSKSRDRNILYDDNRHKEPADFIRAVTMISANKRPVNMIEMEKVLNLRHEEMSRCQLTYGKDSDEYVSARGKYYNDWHCLKVVIHNSEPIPDMTGISLYRPSYKSAKSGRATEIGGGMQSCSREMKAASIIGIENIHNYDLVSSQINILVNQLKIAGIDSAPFEQYRDDKESKKRFAKRIGISVDCWKACFLAMVMGAYVPRRVRPDFNRKNRPKNSILRKLLEEFDYDLEKTANALVRFREAIQPFSQILNDWHDYLLYEYVPHFCTFAKGKKYLTNSLGKKLCQNHISKLHYEIKSIVAAFLLQGDEAYFIHKLTALGVQYGFKVVGNEHDGVITIGTIPREAIQEAARQSGLVNAEMIEKPFIEAPAIVNQNEETLAAVIKDNPVSAPSCAPRQHYWFKSPIVKSSDHAITPVHRSPIDKNKPVAIKE